MGLDVYSSAPEAKSEKYPEHMFTKVYLRSSYNDGGFNRVTDNLVGMTLYDVFPHPDDVYEFTPNWQASLDKAIILRDKLLALDTPYTAMCESAIDVRPQDGEITSIPQAIELFNKELSKPITFKEYSNAKGSFFLKEPIPIYAVIRGTDILNQPCLYLITKTKAEDLQWYKQAAEIVVEFCKHGLEYNARISWSS